MSGFRGAVREMISQHEQDRADAVAEVACPKCLALPAEECSRNGVKSTNPHLQRVARLLVLRDPGLAR